MKSALSHLLWAAGVLLLLWFATWCRDCGQAGGKLLRTPHGIECLSPSR